MIKIYTAWPSQQQLSRKAHMNADTINRFAWNYCVFISFPFIIIIKSVYYAVGFYYWTKCAFYSKIDSYSKVVYKILCEFTWKETTSSLAYIRIKASLRTVLCIVLDIYRCFISLNPCFSLRGCAVAINALGPCRFIAPSNWCFSCAFCIVLLVRRVDKIKRWKFNVTVN